MMTPAEWISACAKRMAGLGMSGTPDLLMIAITLANEQAELHGSSAIAWERPEDVAERCADDQEEA